MRKAELMGISTDIFPVDNADTSSSVDGRRKHKLPALSSDFVTYYLGNWLSMLASLEALLINVKLVIHVFIGAEGR